MASGPREKSVVRGTRACTTQSRSKSWTTRAGSPVFHRSSRKRRATALFSSRLTAASSGARLPRQGPEQPQGRTGVVVLPVEAVNPVVGEALALRIGILAHAVERQRLHGLGEGGVGVAVLGPAVDQEQEVAPPA